MSKKEYIVTLHKDVDYEKFNEELAKKATVVNARPASLRNTHYMLTEEEAEQLRLDDRVLGVTLPLGKGTSKIIKSSVQTGDFSKTTSTRGFFVNWGLRRLNETEDPYNGDTVAGGYEYVLDGTGVDVVIVDSGIQADHPEFQDAEGISRVIQLDWYDETGLAGTMPTGHYTDLDGHGTHVAAIVAGKTYGWAKNAVIYAIKIDDLKGSTDPNNGIPISDAFDLIKTWHIGKNQTETGFRRPTIVVTGWTEVESFTSILGGGYRGTVWIDNVIKPEYGMIGTDLLGDGDLYTGVRNAAIDADIDELIAEGIYVVTPAGNTSQKIDILGGDDYDNYFTKGGGPGTVFYHRGGSPYSEDAITVANVDAVLEAGGSEQKSITSATGPGVDIFAPGTNIMSACSNTADFTTGPYPGDDSYNILNLSGTSMAAAQVAGILALYAQINPSATPAIAKAWLLDNTVEDVLYETGNDADYSDTRSILGANNRFAYNKFSASKKLNVGR